MKKTKQEKKRFIIQIIAGLLVVSMIISFVIPFVSLF